MPKSLSRREVLIGTAAVGAAAGGGVAWLATADVKPAALAFFKRALPGVAIDEKSAMTCIDDFVADWPLAKRLVLATAWNTAGVDTMAAVHDRFQSPARHLLTHFLINSNFFQVKDPKAQPIVYTRQPPGSACANPFANLDPPV